LVRLIADGVFRLALVIDGELVNTTFPVPLVEYDAAHAAPVELAIPAPGYGILPPEAQGTPESEIFPP
jgi:hypothetical protein